MRRNLFLAPFSSCSTSHRAQPVYGTRKEVPPPLCHSIQISAGVQNPQSNQPNNNKEKAKISEVVAYE